MVLFKYKDYQMLERVYLFTFQYGSIQIEIDIDVQAKVVDLHSNMVLFK